MQILGLSLIFIWMAVLVAAVLILHKFANIPTFYTRKLLHIGTALVWIIGAIMIGNTWHMFIPNTLSFIAIVASYFMKPIEGIESEVNDGEPRNYGTLYFAISTMFITACNFSDFLYPCAGLSFCALTFGDGLAAVCGKLAGKHNPKICGNKTVVGTVVCFVATFITALAFNISFNLNFSLTAMLAIAGLVAILELYTPFGLDNITIPLVMLFFTAALRLGLVQDAVLLICAISPLMAIIALSKKIFTPVAGAMAFVILILFATLSGFIWILNIFAGYGFILIAKLVRKISKRTHIIQKTDFVIEKDSARGFKQLISNLYVPMIFVAVYSYTHIIAFQIGAFAAFACAIGDSMASDIGVLQKAKPYDICRFRPVESGESGGISLLGSSAAVIVTAINCLICFFIAKITIMSTIAIGAAALIGIFFDSILGSLVQAKYRCSICGKRLENKICCSKEAHLISGTRFIDNNMVNVISNCLSAVFGIVITLVLI